MEKGKRKNTLMIQSAGHSNRNRKGNSVAAIFNARTSVCAGLK